MRKDPFITLMQKLGIELFGDDKLVKCPTCEKLHRWGTAGQYCNMTCYYLVN